MKKFCWGIESQPMEELLNYFLRYGMFLGAIFQLVCIAAVIILPEHNKPYRVSSKNAYVCTTCTIRLYTVIILLIMYRKVDSVNLQTANQIAIFILWKNYKFTIEHESKTKKKDVDWFFCFYFDYVCIAWMLFFVSMIIIGFNLLTGFVGTIIWFVFIVKTYYEFFSRKKSVFLTWT